MNCKNCDQITNGNFCTNCGQSTKVDRINLLNFLGELSDSVFQINKGLFYTMKALFVSPGNSIKEYLNGKRKNHFKPVAYLFTLSTIYFLLSQFVESETILNDAITGWSNLSEEPDIKAEELTILNWFANNYTYTMLLLLPLYTLASYLSFSGSKYNYLEHFVLNAYITGQQAILYSISAMLILLTGQGDFLAIITHFLSFFYTLIVYSQFFSKSSRIAVILRWILTYALYLIMVSLIIFMILIIIQ